MQGLSASWRRAWAGLAGSPPVGLYDELIACYGAPTRHYHSLQHLEECIACHQELRASMQRPAELEMALWFHDAIYDARAKDNEVRSAEWARAALRAAGCAAVVGQRVHDLVMATRHETAAAVSDAGLLVDIDLAILGAARERYDEYEVQIRAEYAWVPLPAYREARAALLRGFLARPAIYANSIMRERFEAAARGNLSRALSQLGAAARIDD